MVNSSPTDGIENPDVARVFQSYPDHVRPKMRELRRIVLDTAREIDAGKCVIETLKWGEPSYLVKGGSTLRMDWKAADPDHYAMYFHCQTRLVDTFKELYGDVFRFQTNRAILFRLDEDVAVAELKHCVELCLRYHRIKHLPMLGA